MKYECAFNLRLSKNESQIVVQYWGINVYDAARRAAKDYEGYNTLVHGELMKGYSREI